MQLTGGRPLFLSRYLTELEQGQFICRTEEGWQLEGAIQREEGTWRPTALADAPEPAGIEALLAQMMDRLLEEDEALLQQGSVQGDTFLSRVLAELADEREIKILGRLRKVAQEHRLIALRHGEGWYQDESERVSVRAPAPPPCFLRSADASRTAAVPPRDRLHSRRGVLPERHRCSSADAGDCPPLCVGG